MRGVENENPRQNPRRQGGLEERTGEEVEIGENQEASEFARVKGAIRSSPQPRHSTMNPSAQTAQAANVQNRSQA